MPPSPHVPPMSPNTAHLHLTHVLLFSIHIRKSITHAPWDDHDALAKNSTTAGSVRDVQTKGQKERCFRAEDEHFRMIAMNMFLLMKTNVDIQP